MTKKNNNNNINTKPTVIILIILIISFFAILLTSMIFKNTTTTYSFNENIIIEKSKLDNMNIKQNEIKIGNVTITNNGILPVREKINSYVLCNFDEENINNEYIITYRGGDINSNYNQIFSSYNNNKYVDVNGKKSSQINLYIPSYYFTSPNKNGEQSQNGYQNTTTLYLFNMEENTNPYGYCSSIEKESYEKIITISII